MYTIDEFDKVKIKILKYLIEDYFYENKEELEEYEIKSATNIIIKKSRDMENDEIKRYLLKKGYRQSSINSAYLMCYKKRIDDIKKVPVLI